MTDDLSWEMNVRARRIKEVGRFPEETVSRAQAQPNPLRKSEREDNEKQSWPKYEHFVNLWNDEEVSK